MCHEERSYIAGRELLDEREREGKKDIQKNHVQKRSRESADGRCKKKKSERTNARAKKKVKRRYEGEMTGHEMPSSREIYDNIYLSFFILSTSIMTYISFTFALKDKYANIIEREGEGGDSQLLYSMTN